MCLSILLTLSGTVATMKYKLMGAVPEALQATLLAKGSYSLFYISVKGADYGKRTVCSCRTDR